MSSGEKKHDYHLVDPSPWPIFTSFACLILAIGAVYYFHTKALWLLLIGTALLIYGSFMWFRDVVDEAEKQGHHSFAPVLFPCVSHARNSPIHAPGG